MKHQIITRKNIRMMVDRFYSQVLKDEVIADFFIDKLGDEMISDEWQSHLTLLTNFWVSLTLDDTAYNGQAGKAHMRVKGLQRETFEQWLKLFFETLDKFYDKEAADVFKKHAQVSANDFMKLLHL